MILPGTYCDHFVRLVSPTLIMIVIMTLYYLLCFKIHCIIMLVLSVGLIKFTSSVLFYGITSELQGNEGDSCFVDGLKEK